LIMASSLVDDNDGSSIEGYRDEPDLSDW